MGEGWKGVWQRRRLADGAETNGLGDLIALDGFDTDAGAIAEAHWLEYTRTVAITLGIRDGHSVYEVGCGSGAFLVGLSRHAAVDVAGCDYSSSMIEVIQRVLPDGEFTVTDADQIPTVPVFDHVVANSVFFYFPDLDYAGKVLDRMLAKSRRSVAVLELPNHQLHKEAEAFRRARFGSDAYAERYASLSHQYFYPEWFESIAAARGIECEILPSMIPNYEQGAFRFSSIFRLGD